MPKAKQSSVIGIIKPASDEKAYRWLVLPNGPMFLNPTSLFSAFHRYVMQPLKHKHFFHFFYNH